MKNTQIKTPLGQPSDYRTHYQPDLLCPIPRKINRQSLGIQHPLPFVGADIWNAYELSWLNTKGKPEIAIAELIIPANSDNLIESKSLKLYLNSFNNTQFETLNEVKQHIKNDLSLAVNNEISVKLYCEVDFFQHPIRQMQGCCLDNLDVYADCYTPNSHYLNTNQHAGNVSETLYSNLLKSNCLVTGQPDWGTIIINYTGLQIQHAGLLKYIISFRNHQAFHEQCVERMFVDILNRCKPDQLTVEARYTRRGGIDINPYRSTEPQYISKNIKVFRQ